MTFNREEQLRKTIKKQPPQNLSGGWLMLLFGLFILSIAVVDSATKLRVFDWVAGNAQVTGTDMYQRTGRSRAWCGRISYTYIVDGRTYASGQLSSAIMSDVGCNVDRSTVTARLATLPIGTVIRVYLDPTSPARVAIIREGLKWPDIFFLLLAVLPLAVGSYLIVQAKRQKATGRTVAALR